MTRSAAHRSADVKRIVGAARAIVESIAKDDLVSRLASSTGLSNEGVERALARHLETSASDADIAKLVERAGNADRVTVILSSNVFVGALRALAVARAASDNVVLRPSTREPLFAELLVLAVQAAGDTNVSLVREIDVAEIDAGEIHVYGRDDTVADVRAHARVPVKGHGTGMGLAWITREANLQATARALTDDIVAFDQRGCLSPRIALVAGGDARASAFAEALHAELERIGKRVPRGTLPREERARSERYIDTMTYAGHAIVGHDHVIGVATVAAPLTLPPPYRHLHIAPCSDREDAKEKVASVAGAVLAFGSDDPAVAKAFAPSWARVSVLGVMQRPPLDGPIDLREK